MNEKSERIPQVGDIMVLKISVWVPLWPAVDPDRQSIGVELKPGTRVSVSALQSLQPEGLVRVRYAEKQHAISIPAAHLKFA